MTVSITDRIPTVCHRCPVADFKVVTQDMMANDEICAREFVVKCRNAYICAKLRKYREEHEGLYTVENGDNMHRIAEKLNVPLHALTSCNTGYFPLCVGDRLIIPREGTY